MMLSLQCDVNTAESLQGLRDRSELCDVVIVSSDGRQTPAHSCVLASHSTVIATVLQSRLAAEHDWSILRPLVINIDEVSVKNSAKQELGGINIVEILISLMYGEIVNVSDMHVPALNEYAHVLGLSDQIFTCLDEGKNFDFRNKKYDQTTFQAKNNRDEYEHVEVLSEINLAHQMFPADISKSSQEKQSADDAVIESFDGKSNPENVLSFSMLCSESQDDDSSGSKTWNDGALSYDKHRCMESQDCNVIVCKLEQDGIDKSGGTQMTTLAKDKNMDSNICSVTNNPDAVLNITVSDQAHANTFCMEGQQLHQQKKQPKKSFICSACGSAFQKCGDLVKHIQNMQHFTVQCPLCFIQVEDSEGQRLHFALHDQPLPFFCVYCDLRFRTRAALTMHTPKHMTSKPEPADGSSNEPDIDEEVTFRVVDEGTQRSKRMLIDNRGFTYTVKRQKGEHTYWCCALRTKHTRCRATVSQAGNNFKVGALNHCHCAKQGGVTSRILSKRIKQEASRDVNASASTIVDKVVSQCTNLEKPTYDVTFHNNLIRKANRVRQKMKQDSSPGLDFELNADFMPSTFLKKDLILGNERHLVFATSTQLELMSIAKMWYLDGNCGIPCQPFVKIFAIHTFISSGEDMDLAPLSYVMMSRCFERDYKEVFASILDMLPQSPKVTTIISDFEKSLWRATTAAFPDVNLQGCAFHWGKAVWKKAQKLGIKAETLKEDEWQEKMLSKVLALPFLPSEHIEPAYGVLCDMVKEHKKFEPFLEYIGSTWISSSAWAVSSWTTFMYPIRTCDDVENWCHRVTHQLSQVNPIFYNIVWLLLQESENIPLDAKASSEDKLRKHQRKEESGIRCKIFNLWDSYLTGTMSSSFFLKKCGTLYCPEITGTTS